jgi:hypothetical protein
VEDRISKKDILKIAEASCLGKYKCQARCLTYFEKVEGIFE